RDFHVTGVQTCALPILAGCGEEREQALVYESPSECAAASFNTPEQCKADYDAAKALHPQVAPKYVSKQECETDFGSGNCETAPQIGRASCRDSVETAET